MKSFVFRLEKILNYRDFHVKRAQKDLYHAKSRVLLREQEIKGLIAKREEVSRQCSTEGLRGVAVPIYHMHKSFQERLDRELEHALLSLHEEKDGVNVKIMALKEASIRKKSLETLKDMQLQRYKKRMETAEQKVMNELVLLRGWGTQ